MDTKAKPAVHGATSKTWEWKKNKIYSQNTYRSRATRKNLLKFLRNWDGDNGDEIYWDEINAMTKDELIQQCCDRQQCYVARYGEGGGPEDPADDSTDALCSMLMEWIETRIHNYEAREQTSPQTSPQARQRIMQRSRRKARQVRVNQDEEDDDEENEEEEEEEDQEQSSSPANRRKRGRSYHDANPRTLKKGRSDHDETTDSAREQSSHENHRVSINGISGNDDGAQSDSCSLNHTESNETRDDETSDDDSDSDESTDDGYPE